MPIWQCVVIAVVAAGLGFLGGFATSEFGREIFEGMFVYEEKADVSTPKELERDLYTLVYPGNWELDEEEEDFDLDNFFTIDTPGGSYLRLQFAYYESETLENVQVQEEYFNDMLGQPVGTDFSSYGGYSGDGRRIKGRLFGLPSTVEIFSHSAMGHSFTLVTVVYDEDRKLVKPGLKLIEDGFVFHPPEDPENRSSSPGEAADESSGESGKLPEE